MKSEKLGLNVASCHFDSTPGILTSLLMEEIFKRLKEEGTERKDKNVLRI